MVLYNTLSLSHERSIDLDLVRALQPRRPNALSAVIPRLPLCLFQLDDWLSGFTRDQIIRAKHMTAASSRQRPTRTGSVRLLSDP